MASNGKADRDSLKLMEFSDRELLIIITEIIAEGGYATTAEIAEAVGLSGPKANKCAGSRMAWLRRFGIVNTDYRRGRREWRLTAVGEVLARGTLNKSQASAIGALTSDQLMLATHHLALHMRGAPPEAGHLMRREWQHSTGRR